MFGMWSSQIINIMFFIIIIIILTITNFKFEIVLFLFAIMFVLPLETILSQFVKYTYYLVW